MDINKLNNRGYERYVKEEIKGPGPDAKIFENALMGNTFKVE